jgi:hypothetical protein
MTGQFLTLFCRYVGAIFAACVVSFGVLMIGLPLLMWAELPGFIVLLVLVGFCGVLMGTFSLPKSNRRFGSFVLVVLGLCFNTFLTLWIYPHNLPPNKFPLVWNLPLAVGGLLAGFAACFRKQRPNQHLQETPR